MWRLTRRRLGVIAVLAGTTLCAAGPARADSVSFGAPVAVAGVEIEALACGSATSCLAVGPQEASGEAGVVVPIANGVPGTPAAIPLPAGAASGAVLSPSAVACPSASVCEVAGAYSTGSAAAGSGAFVATVNDGAPASAQVSTAAAAWSAIACWSASGCLAAGTGADDSGEFAAHALVTGGVPGTVSDDGTAASAYAGVGCEGVSSCDAIGTDPGYDASVLVPIDGGAAGAPVSFDSGVTPSGFACDATASCLGLGTGDYRTVAGTSLGPVVQDPNTDVAGACPTSSDCLLVGDLAAQSAGDVDEIVGGAAGPTFSDPAVSTFDTIACGSATSCLAVGDGSGQTLVPVTFAAGGSGASPGAGGGGGGGGTKGMGGSPVASVRVGRARQRRGIVSVALSCSGARCAVTLAETIRERVRRRGRTTLETVTVASRRVTLAAGAHATETLSLDRAGHRVLHAASERRLKVRLTVRLVGHAPDRRTITLT